MIVPDGDKTTEKEMAFAIEAYLTTRAYGWAPYLRPQSDGIFFNVQRFIQLTPADREPSNSRAAEKKYHMIIRNAYRYGERHGLFVKKDGGLQLASRAKKKQQE
jgi:hypothetical protein